MSKINVFASKREDRALKRMHDVKMMNISLCWINSANCKV
jgi:hypothetical protein